jgi:NTE family protein
MKDIALVLSSGGARGIAHIGVIEELLDRGYNITSISGTSMGAVVGGIYASGKFKEFKEWMCQLDKKEVFRLVDFSVSRSGIVKGDKVIEHMKKFIPDKNIEELEIPFCAIAVDIHKGEEVVFTKGSMFDAIRASISIPAVFKPAKINGVYYVDGGILNPLPLNRVDRKENDILVAVMVNARGVEDFDIIKKGIKNELSKEEQKVKGKSIDNDSLKEKISNFILK